MSFARFATSTLFSTLLCLAPLAAQQDDLQEVIALRNWAAPPFWKAPVPRSLPDDVPEPEGLRPLETDAVQGFPTSPLPFVAITPCRIADTRGNGFTGQAGPPALNTGPRVFQITGTVVGVPTQCGIPSGAEAVSFQFTIVLPNSAGNLIAWPGGPAPTISVLNWSAGETALGNGTVVPISPTGSLNVQINAAIGGATGHLVLDVNGYYGPSLDSLFVNELQNDAITTGMIQDSAVTSAKIENGSITTADIGDGEIVNADINASAVIADTKLATIATAGKVADSALSANVTKLGPTIEASEITNITRSVNLPLLSFYDCQGGTFLDFSSGPTDPIADFFNDPVDGEGLAIEFDATPGNEDQNSELCSQLMAPPDYVSGGVLRVRILKPTDSGDTEVLTCGATVDGTIGTTGDTTIAGGVSTTYSCTPGLASTPSPGSSLGVFFSITSSGTMNQPVFVSGASFEYVASQ